MLLGFSIANYTVDINNLNTISNLLKEYKNSSHILFQLRNYKVGNFMRIFPYCENLEDGRNKFNEFEKFLTTNK